MGRIFVSFLLISCSICLWAESAARLDVSGGKTVKLKPGLKPAGGVINNPSWGGGAYGIYSQGRELDNYEWRDYSMSFIPEADGVVSINLLGSYSKKDGVLQPLWICWKDVKVEGAEAVDKNWMARRENRIDKNGEKYLKAWHNVHARRKYKVTAGKEVKVSAKVRRYKEPAYPVSLKTVANRGFRDEVERDGKGGWSDQGGPKRDLRNFDVSRCNYAGMEFDVVDPAKNQGKAVVTLDSPYDKSGVKQIALDIPEKASECRYLYLLHSSCWNARPYGEEVGQINVKFANGTSKNIPIRAQVDVADWAGGDNNRNAQAFKFRQKGDDIDKAVFLSRFDLGGGKKTSFTLSSPGKVVWIVVGATLSDRMVVLDEASRTFRANRDWKVVDLSDVVVKSGSALDFSRLVEPGPAGKHGRAIVGKNGILAFEDNPDQPVRFFVTGNILSWVRYEKDVEKRHKRIRDFIAQVKTQGYNCMRYWVDVNSVLKTQKSLTFDVQAVDDMDYFMAEAKAAGIYAFIDLASYGLYQKNPWGETMKNRNVIKAKMMVGDPEVRYWWETGTRMIMEHVNPYTKIAWKDEKAIIFTDFYNEQEMGKIFILRKNPEKLGKKTYKLLLDKWRQYLKNRYGSTGELAKAWKSRELSGKSFDDVMLPDMPLNQPERRSSSENDYWLFIMSMQQENMSWYHKIIRDTGYKGLATSMNMINDFKDGAVRSEYSELIIANKYFAHPSAFTRVGSRCKQESSLDKYADLPRSLCVARLWDRPLFVSEWNHAFWNQYQHEAGLLNPAYFALQGFYGAQAHSGAVMPFAKSPMSDFSIGRSPVGRANEFLATCLFMRGDVKPSPHRVELLVDKKYLTAGCNSARSVHSDQSKVALVCGFGLNYQGWPKASGAVADPAADLVMTPMEGASASATGWTADIIEKQSGKNRVKAVFAELRRKGILSKNNITDPDKGIFQTDTGEILLNCGKRRIEIRTPRTEGATVNPGSKVVLRVLNIDYSSEPAAVALCSVDDKVLAESGRMVLVYTTYAVNTGMELSQSLVTLRKQGKYPALMKTGVLKVKIKTKNKNFKLYALRVNGERCEEIPLKYKDGCLQARIDTGTLKHGPTPFFEFAINDK